MQPTDLLILASDTAFSEIALVIFFAVFVCIVLWVTISRSDYFARSAQIPLHDDEVVDPRTAEQEMKPEEAAEAPRNGGSES